MKASIESEAGSTNVYRDLGYPDPDAMLRKAMLAVEITRGLQTRNLRQVEAGELFGCDPARVSQLICGRFRTMSEAELADMLGRLHGHHSR